MPNNRSQQGPSEMTPVVRYESYDLLVERQQDLIVAIALDGTLLFVSPACETFGGYDPTQQAGSSIARYFADPAELAAALERMRAAAEERRDITIEMLFAPQGGEPFPVEMSVHPVEHDSGQIVHHAILRDIRDRKRVESEERRLAAKERERLQHQLQRAQKMEAIGRLAGGVAHDFNNILTSIMGYAEVMLAALEPDSELAADCLEIRSAAERAATLTGQLLSVSRKQIIEPQVMDINQSIELASRMISKRVGEDVALTLELASEVWRVKADQAQLEQVLVNLATNARDAMAGGGRLRICTENVTLVEPVRGSEEEIEPGEFVLLSVHDNGEGTTPLALPRAFEPLFSTKPPGMGTGLGPSTVYGIMHQHGGRITVSSIPGEGTSVRAYFPRARHHDLADSAPQSPVAAPKGSGTILLVEDETVVRKLALRILQRQGYEVIEAEHAAQAMELAAAHGHIDLLLTDVVMPEMNGRQLYEELVKARPGLKVLYMSGYAENILARHGVLDEGTHLLKKPFNIGPLASKVREVLESPR